MLSVLCVLVEIFEKCVYLCKMKKRKSYSLYLLTNFDLSYDTILPKVLAMKGLTTLVISMSTNLNV